MIEVTLPRLYERDIDVLLQEEMIFCEALRDCISRALGLSVVMSASSCQLSVVDATGETDLYVNFSVGDRRGVLLIENKIDAEFQPLQPERYRLRARALAEATGQDYVFCLLIAPASYVSARDETKLGNFDKVFSYEDIAKVIESVNTPRSSHRAALILRALEQTRSAYTMTPVEEVGNLWQRVYGIACKEFPQLQMSRPTAKGAQSKWMIFKADLPKRVTIDWKITQATVDLSFWKGSLSRPLSIPSNLLPSGATITKSGKTDIVRLNVSPPPPNWIELGESQIREALETSARHLEFFRQHRSRMM